MPKLPRLTALEIAAVLERIGFSLARQSGSHQNLQECRRQKGYGSVSRLENSPPESPEEHFARRRSKSWRPGEAALNRLRPPVAHTRRCLQCLRSSLELHTSHNERRARHPSLETRCKVRRKMVARSCSRTPRLFTGAGQQPQS